MARNRWTVTDIPDQAGRVAVVTGANKDLGFATAQELAARGAHVVLAVRDKGNGAAALARIRERHPASSIEVQQLDLSSLASDRAARSAKRTVRPSGGACP
ncbi:SDR family NAD(P)-dependent oxidoreductase [Nonomuraea sp. NPDC005650]|uniref:SDR family NAD(P)-dependent oxidoreductase n=1 Tax=Nonomuraea sp. NPDC005650 TaxID=3157045 RepID=UPI0033B9A40F